MPTTVTKSIGATGRDYATHALWIAACPSNLVTADQVWAGQSYNDAQFTITAEILISGITTDATRYVDLNTGTGQGWRDAASPIMGANQSKGVLITTSTAYQTTLRSTISVFKLHNHQVTNTSGSNRRPLILTAGSNDSLVENCIFEGADLGAQVKNGIIRNSISILLASNSNSPWDAEYSSVVAVSGCGAVRPSNFTAGGTGFTAVSGTILIYNCYSFGCTTFATSGRFSGSNNATDQASISFGTSNVASVPFTTATFQVVTNTGHDYRLVAGSSLLNVGLTETTYIPAANDAFGTSRPQGSAWDIGPHELIVAAASVVAKLFNYNQAVKRASYF